MALDKRQASSEPVLDQSEHLRIVADDDEVNARREGRVMSPFARREERSQNPVWSA
jgi:hypothetical protein